MDYRNEYATCKVLAREVFTTLGVPHFAEKIDFDFSHRMTRCIGLARLGRWRITLNANAFRILSEDEKDDTIIHEVCHFVAYYIYREKGHGYHWQNCMLKCGRQPKRCKEMPAEYDVAIAHLQRRRQAKVRVTCGCPNGSMMGPTQYRRMKNGVSYRCRKCGSSIRG